MNEPEQKPSSRARRDAVVSDLALIEEHVQIEEAGRDPDFYLDSYLHDAVCDIKELLSLLADADEELAWLMNENGCYLEIPARRGGTEWEAEIWEK